MWLFWISQFITEENLKEMVDVRALFIAAAYAERPKYMPWLLKRSIEALEL